MTLVPTDALVRPVEGRDDLFAFRFDFIPEGKAVDAPVVTETDDGDLIIEGYAAVFSGDDREGENFAEGAFEEGVKSFLDGPAALCFHHKHDHVIGGVLDLRQEQGKGLWMKARVDHQKETSPLRWIYDGIKKRSIKGLSIGGFFKRAIVDGARKIVGVDFTEISTTGVPVHPGTSFAVVAGKALEDFDAPEQELDLSSLLASIKSVTEAFGKALPESHDVGAANALGELLVLVQKARTACTSMLSYHEHEGFKDLADALETDLARHEAAMHTLAAEIGPLPPSYNF